MRFGIAWLTILVVTLASVAAVQVLTRKHPLLGLLGYFGYLAAVVGVGLMVAVR